MFSGDDSDITDDTNTIPNTVDACASNSEECLDHLEKALVDYLVNKIVVDK